MSTNFFSLKMYISFSDEERERGDLPDDYKAIHIDEKVITHPHLNVGNSGEYICQANSSFGIVSKKINVTG